MVQERFQNSLLKNHLYQNHFLQHEGISILIHL